MIQLTASLFTWNPGFRGIFSVAVMVVILCGSVALILGTNSGARHGFLLALTGFVGWMLCMGLIWSIYGIGYKGKDPSWHWVETVRGEPSGANLEVARSLLLPDQLPDPVDVRNGDEKLLEQFPVDARNPSLGDLIGVDPELKTEVNDKLGAWELLPTTSGYTGETQSVVSEVLVEEGLFENANGYSVVESFITGGKARRTDNSIVGRIKYKLTSPFEFDNKDFYAVVQVQGVVPQTTKAGQAPPLPVRDADAPVYSIILERDRGNKRQPAIFMTIFMGVSLAVLCSMLHRRDLESAKLRAQPAGA